MASEEKLIDKINKLMALAMDGGATEGEREAARQMADRLILKNAIDRAKLGTPDEKKTDIISETWEMPFSEEFYEQIRSLCSNILWVCDCRGLFSWRKVTVVGFPEDIAYARGLWMIAFREMAFNLDPAWEAEKSFEKNVYDLVKAGYKWREIAAKGNVKWPDNGKLKRAYLKHCHAIGEQAQNHTSRHGAFRLSYANSFTSTITRRIQAMRERSMEDVSDSDKAALALIPTMQQVNAEFYRLYPQFDPENLRKQGAEAEAREAARRAAMTQEERDREDAKAAKEEARWRKHYERTRNVQHDEGGWRRGNYVASRVDLSMGKGHINPNRTEIGQ